MRLAILFLLIPLAGCSGIEGACTVQVPALTGGDGAWYDATGRPNDGFSTTVAWWPDGASPEGHKGTVTLPPGSRIGIIAAATPEARLARDGGFHEGIQVTSWFEHEDIPGRLAYADHWVGLEGANILQDAARASSAPASETQHFTKFPDGNEVAFFLSSLFWDKVLRAGDRDVFDIPFGNSMGATGNTFPLEWAVTAIAATPSGCQATLRVTYDYPDFPGERSGTVVWADDSPFPVRFDQVWGARHFTADRLASVAGTGHAIDLDAPWTPQERPPVVAVPHAFPSGTIQGATIQYAQALALALDNDELQAWLAVHPDAQPHNARYGKGNPDGRVIDGFSLDWQDETERVNVRVHAQHEGVPFLEPADIIVYFNPQSNLGDAAPSPPGDWITVETLQEMHLRHTGIHADAVRCESSTGSLGAPHCMIGTRAAMQWPYIDGGGMGSPTVGLLVYMQTGEPALEISWDPSSLGPPVPLPAEW